MTRLLLGLFLCVAVATNAAAQETGAYERTLAEAMRLSSDLLPGEPEDAPLDRAYTKLAEAAQIAPRRWEAFALRGANRCTKAVVCRRMLAARLIDLQAVGAGAEQLAVTQQRGLEFIDRCVADARHAFLVMDKNVRAANGAQDPDLIVFANASMKYARGEYLTAAGGARGAIDDFKALVARGWRVRWCAEFIARCYLQVGAAAYLEAANVSHDFRQAHAYWDEGLRWAQEETTRRAILMNRAGTFERDGDFASAKRVLRDQIDRDPSRPAQWMYLGLILGYENRLREALRAYDRARRLCVQSSQPKLLAAIYGNAWLKAAMIHGKLLEEDGDMRLAWRLFLEYRQIHGDNYNFCLNFGDFAYHMGQPDLAAKFLERAKELQPFCLPPYTLLLQVAARRGGTREEIVARIETAKEELRVATERHAQQTDESPGLQRLCNGLRDPDSGGTLEHNPLIEPDPLAEFGPDTRPEWIEAVARERQPFQADRQDPEPESADGPPAGPAGSEPPAPEGPGFWNPATIALIVALAAAVLLALRRRRAVAS